MMNKRGIGSRINIVHAINSIIFTTKYFIHRDCTEGFNKSQYFFNLFVNFYSKYTIGYCISKNSIILYSHTNYMYLLLLSVKDSTIFEFDQLLDIAVVDYPTIFYDSN